MIPLRCQGSTEERQKYNADSDVVQSHTKFKIYWCLVTILLVTASGNAIPPSYVNVVLEFGLARQKQGVWIFTMPDWWSMVELVVELKCLPNFIETSAWFTLSSSALFLLHLIISWH